MARKHLLIMALVLVLSGGAGAMLWHGHDSGQAGAAADSAAAEAGFATFLRMPLLLVPLGGAEGPVAYVPVAPELHLATEADKEGAVRDLTVTETMRQRR